MGDARWFATCARGIEPVLAGELAALGAARVTAVRAGCQFDGSPALAWRACLELRTASRVLQPIAAFAAPDAAALYDGARAVPWEEHLGGPERTFAVHAAAHDSAIAHTHFAALKTKDAVADRLRERWGARPDVDARDPDVAIFLRLDRDEATLSLDLCGESLHRRGYRPPGPEAPLKETLAAACVALTGWSGDVPLVDPMCGSGTLLLEGALAAARVAPGLLRLRAGGRFGLQRWPGHDTAAFEAIVAEARARVRPITAAIEGSDRDDRALALARRGEELAGPPVTGALRWTVRALEDAAPPAGAPPGVLLVNPPYGERLGRAEDLGPLYATLGDVLKRRFTGWTAHVLAGAPALAKQIGLRPARRVPLWNGAIECRLLRFDLY